MTEPVLGIAGAVLLALALAALFLRPRRSRGRFVDAGLAIGTGLLGLAIGLAVADRVHRPAVLTEAPVQPAPAPEPAASPQRAPPLQPSTQTPPSQPPAPSIRYVESRLSLQFPADDEYPTVAGSTNVADWYAFRNSINYIPRADEKTSKSQDELLKLLADVSWNWLIVVAFDQPTQYSRLDVTFTGGQLPYYQIVRQNPHYAIIHVQGRIPAGQMDIATAE